jgi:hypothetical protein
MSKTNSEEEHYKLRGRLRMESQKRMNSLEFELLETFEKFTVLKPDITTEEINAVMLKLLTGDTNNRIRNQLPTEVIDK